MPKRRRQFEDDYVPQSKVRLTKKGYEQSNAKAMENVWNKTRDLLFQGARKSPVEKVGDVNAEERCDYCQKYFNSLNSCHACGGCYCSDCSLSTYGENVGEFICLSCA